MRHRSSLTKDTRTFLLRPGTILVVDDDIEFRAQIRTLLEGEGYDAVCLESANHALRYMQAQPWNWYPWLLITDLVMDGMGGYQLMRRISEFYPNRTIPMVVISRLGTSDDMNEAEQAGATAFLRKPFDPKALVAAIKKATANKQKRLELKIEDREL